MEQSTKMKLGYLVGLLALGVGLGACGGFSDLGEGVGGEASMDGGTGGSGTGGGHQAMGGSSMAGETNETGGSNAMGGSQAMGGSNSTGGSSHVMGGANAMGGSMTGGSNAMGGSMTGGTSGAECMVADDCPQPPPVCDMCLNGVSACPAAVCENGVCDIRTPECLENIPCNGKACGEPCISVDAAGKVPPMSATACDASGRCVDASQELGCMGKTETPCDTAMDCPSVVEEDCIICGDGSRVCPENACLQGACVALGASCDDGACMVSADCPPLPPVCLPCGDDGSCAGNLCLSGHCTVLCDTGHACETAMDCPSETPENACTMGPWQCVDESCALFQGCPASM
jgi:hypothetical protein